MLNKKNNSGFTLVEIIIAVAIISILLGVASSNFFSIKENSDLKNNAQEFVSALKFAQNKAVSSEDNSKYGIYINTQVSPNLYILFKGDSYASRIPASDQVNFLQDTIEFNSVDLGGGNEMVFDRLTGASEESGSISLRVKSNANKSKTVYISGTGAINYNPPPTGSLDTNRVVDSRHVEFVYNRYISTSDESITLTFNNSKIETVPIVTYLSGGQMRWKSTVDVDGSNQTVEIDTIRLNDSDTLFSIFRDARLNNKSLKIAISGDSSGYLVGYSADGSSIDSESSNVTGLERK